MTISTQDQIDFANKASLIVRRTAQYGLSQSQESNSFFEKWLLIWACDVAAELGEVFDAETEREQVVECGDVLWGLTAICLLIDVPPIEVFRWDGEVEGSHDTLIVALKLLDHCKKVARDGMGVRKIDTFKIIDYMRSIFTWLESNYPLDDALNEVNKKLLKRYPDGYSAERSVNR
jgi:hypothetical protein